MTLRRPLRCLAACLLLAALNARAQAPAIEDPGSGLQQVLVMLRLPPPHYRPDQDYPGGYDAVAGHEARRRAAGDLAHRHGLTLAQDWAMPALGVDCFVMSVAPGDSLAEKVSALAQDGRVESVQPMYRFHALGHHDPLFALQPAATAWHLDDLHALTTGRGIAVAQVDSGVDLDHPDLAGQFSVAENFVDTSDYAQELHGTEVAGVIAARADNGVGIAGVAPAARLMILRACWQRDGGTTLCNSFTLAKALQFALDRRARVINLSLSGPHDRLVERLLDAAFARGIVVVAASDPAVPDGGFPASHPRALSVGAEFAPDQGEAVHARVLAPGRDVPTTQPGGQWGFVSGTSFAAAHVSGLVALMLQLAPGLAPSDVVALLRPAQRPVDISPADAPDRIDACAVIARLVPGGRACDGHVAPHVVSLH